MKLEQTIFTMPGDMKREFKTFCVKEGKPMRQVLINLVYAYIKKRKGENK